MMFARQLVRTVRRHQGVLIQQRYMWPIGAAALRIGKLTHGFGNLSKRLNDYGRR